MDRETLIEMRNGNEESFRIIVMETQPPLFSFIMNFVLDRTVAKDLLQDTYIRIWQNRWRYDVDRNFMTWALAIAANICKGYLRKSGSYPCHCTRFGLQTEACVHSMLP